MTIKGIDVSNYQASSPDLTGQDFCVVKATEGTTYTNPLHAAQVAHARSAGAVVGHYHFVRDGSMPAEVDYFLKQSGAQAGDFLVLDWEDPSVSNAEKDSFLTYLHNRSGGKKGLLYCDLDYWKNRDSTSDCGDGLWIADPSHPAGKPDIGHAWIIHQYSSSGGIDHNVANFSTRAAMKTWTGSSESPSKPVTPPKPTPAPTKPSKPAYTAPAFPKGLAPNKSKPSAKKLQQALKDSGFMPKSVKLSDNYGPATQKAVAAFNGKYKLNSKGKTSDPAIGPTGWKKLFTLAYA